MSKKENAKALLRILSDIDDKYITEATEFSVKKSKKKTRKIIRLQKTIKATVAIAACLAIVFVGRSFMNISKTDPDENPPTTERNSDVQVESPIIEVDSIEKAESITGFDLTYPEAEDPYTKTIISVYDRSMIEVSFTAEDESDSYYYIRKSAGSEDISGDYNDYSNTATENISGYEVTLKGDDKWSVATWTVDGYSYSIGCQEHPKTIEEISKIIENVK